MKINKVSKKVEVVRSVLCVELDETDRADLIVQIYNMLGNGELDISDYPMVQEILSAL